MQERRHRDGDGQGRVVNGIEFGHDWILSSPKDTALTWVKAKDEA